MKETIVEELVDLERQLAQKTEEFFKNLTNTTFEDFIARVPKKPRQKDYVELILILAKDNLHKESNKIEIKNHFDFNRISYTRDIEAWISVSDKGRTIRISLSGCSDEDRGYHMHASCIFDLSLSEKQIIRKIKGGGSWTLHGDELNYDPHTEVFSINFSYVKFILDGIIKNKKV
ncbi:MAG: hypothetical protein WC795_02745 [Candidatus Paceibacterota bacterium]|jgi:hypothetical protein